MMDRCIHLSCNKFIRLHKMLPALRMPDHYIFNLNRTEHTCGDLTCESSIFMIIQILSPDIELTLFCNICCHFEVNKGRAEDLLRVLQIYFIQRLRYIGYEVL